MRARDPYELLRTAGLRATSQRVALLSVLEKGKEPESVETLVRRSRGALDLATAYRTLEQFAKSGLVRRVELGRNRALYESAEHHHHHAVCTSCGKVVDVSACMPQTLVSRVKASSKFARIDSHALEFFGVCASCAAKKRA